jgi:TPP-dependent pyruvate/acetoin dehydrogenase alpha subunit
VERARRLAIDIGGFSAAELKEIEKVQRKVVDEAVELAKVRREQLVGRS